MRIAPLDLRQQRFSSRHARLRPDRGRRVPDRGGRRLRARAARDRSAAPGPGAQEALLDEHRERENNLRNTLLTAQRLADEIKESAQTEAKLIVREAQGRADLLLQKAQARLEEVERDINELRLRRRDVEGSLESSIQALYRALEFIRDQDSWTSRTTRSCSIARGRRTPRPSRGRPARRRAPPRIATRPPRPKSRSESSPASSSE